MNLQKIQKFVVVPIDAFKKYREVLCIFKHLVMVFGDSQTFHFRAFVHLERAIYALGELMLEKDNTLAEGFQTSLISYTTQSKEAGVWVLSYLLTRAGHDDFNERIRGVPRKARKYLDYFPRAKNKYVEELEETIDDINNEDAAEFLQTELENHEGVPEFGPANIPLEDIVDPEFASHLDSAKKFLWDHLKHESFSERSAGRIMELFTGYIERFDPFPHYCIDNPIGYSWKQIAMSFPDFRPIADIALRLHNSVCSEASCERTISAQKLILTARRKKSKSKLLDARLTLMRARKRVTKNADDTK